MINLFRSYAPTVKSHSMVRFVPLRRRQGLSVQPDILRSWGAFPFLQLSKGVELDDSDSPAPAKKAINVARATS